MSSRTLPPCASHTCFISSWKRSIRRLSGSGSSRSPIAVDPITSQDTTDTVLRNSRGAAAS